MEFHPFPLMFQCVWVFFFMIQCQGSLDYVDEERTALLEIKASVWYNDLLSTWVENRASNYCAWKYVQCSKTTGCVSRLNLADVFSTGRSNSHPLLNASLFLSFKDLHHLDISDNEFVSWEYNHGIEKLSNLKKLRILSIGGNHFNSNVLEPLSELTSLKALNLSHNDIGAGSFSEIPRGFCELKRLQGIVFSSNELKGKIPPCLKNFTSLRELDLSSNQLSGNIPPSLTSNMSSLRKLDLSKNQLTGSIPPSLLFNLTSFIVLDLSYNKLTGNLPQGLASNIPSLRVLDFSDNQLSGSIPPLLIFNMTSLHGLSFTNNHLDATTLMTSLLPQKSPFRFLGLGNCNLNISTKVLLKFLHLQRNLRYIDLSHNNIYGKFPAWLLDNNTWLEYFLLRNNSISGRIQFPVRTTELTWIDISENQIEGCLTKTVGDILHGITHLNFSSNRLDGNIPTSLVNMVSLSSLDLSNNNFIGEVPESLASLPKLEYLILSDNKLHGQISPLHFNFTQMRTLLLRNNQFTGFVPIPNQNIGSYRFEILDVSHNNISGGIPTWIANLTSLTALVMGDNSFNGPIPFELCNLSSIEFLELSYNDFSGSIPSCLNLPGLKYLHLQENILSGPIPVALRRSTDLVTLDLNGNKFSGGIPGWIGLLQGLRLLLLKGNRLSGFLPSDLCKLTKIGILDLSYNDFSGAIPSCFRNITFGKTEGIELDAEASMATMRYKLPVPTSYELSENSTFESFVSQQEVDFVIKSLSRSYKGVALKDMGGIDLSCNRFTGKIPPELGTLIWIHSLNLSHNQLTGSIPTTLSKLKQLESMDLSHNRLSGEIPSELIDINTLAVFLVAYNNLSGRLPDMKAQFATFTETSYEGNPFLCGPPLPKTCNNTSSTGSVAEPVAALSDKFGVDGVSFLASCVSAYISSFLGLVIVLYIIPHWRRLWFDFIDACLSFMFPFWSEAFYRVSNP